MSRQVSHDTLRRMVSPPPPAPEDVPITSSRAMRLAVTRAADKTHQIAISVLGVREELVSLEDLIAMLTPDLMLIAMTQDAGMVGIAALDLQLRAALIEAQTIGKIIASNPDDRPPTRTDARMALPLLNAILTQMQETTLRTPLDGWGVGIAPDGLVADARSASLVLPEQTYRVVRMTLDLQAADRQGDLLLVMPDHRSVTPIPEAPKEDSHWATRFQATVNAAPVRLDAELHRFKMPLFAARDIAVGQVIPLTGCHVTSVKLRAGDGRKVATARLGQSGGMRAVRIETASLAEMTDLDQIGGGGGAAGLPMPDADLGFGMDGMDGMENDFAAPDMSMDQPMGLDDDPTAGPLDSVDASMAAEVLEGIEAELMPEMADQDPESGTSVMDGSDGIPEAAPLDWSDEGFEVS